MSTLFLGLICILVKTLYFDFFHLQIHVTIMNWLEWNVRKVKQAPKSMTLRRLGILRWLVKSKSTTLKLISTLKISAMLDYGKDCFRKIFKGIRINKSCCYIYVLAVIVTVRQGFSAVTNASTTVNDRWPADILSAETLEKGDKMLKVINVKIPVRRQWGHYGVFIVNFENISHLFLVFLLLNLNK